MARTGGQSHPRPRSHAAAGGPESRPWRAVPATAVALLLAVAACGPAEKRTPERPDQSPAISIDRIKPITGTWLNVQWPDGRYKYMNEPQAAYTCDDWALKVSELAEIGMQYIVFQSVAHGGKAFYRSALMPGAGLACDDPVGAVVRAAEKHGLKVFMSCEFVNGEDDDLCDLHIMDGRIAVMREIAAQFGASPAFYGWYFSAEGDAGTLFDPRYVEYVNRLAAEAHRLTPGAKILIAPNGLQRADWSDEYLRQIESMEVDIIAYQDKVACVQSPNPLEVSRAQFAAARGLHDRVPRIELWADIETFAWEGYPNFRSSALVPAPFPRVLEQMAAVSPYVDRILAFTMQGMADKPGSPAPTGHPTAGEQYRQYRRFLARELDALVLTDAIAGRVRHAAVGARVRSGGAEDADRGPELTDGATASLYGKRDGWVVFEDGAIDVIVDLGRSMKIDYVGIHLLVDHWNGVFLPHTVRFSVSADGSTYVPAGDAEPFPWHLANHDTRREIVAAAPAGTTARYVRVTSRGLRVPNGVNPRGRSVLASEIIVNPEVRIRPGTPLARIGGLL